MRNSNTIENTIIKYFSCQTDSYWHNPEFILYTIYVLYKISKQENPADVEYTDVINSNDELLSLVASKIDTKIFVELSFLLRNHTTEEFSQSFSSSLDKLFSGKTNESTSATIVNIANRILNINSNDSLLDIGCATGNYILSDQSIIAKQSLGIDINASKSLIARMRADILNSNSKFVTSDYYSMFEDLAKENFSKIFCHFPWALRNENAYEQLFFEKYYKSEIDTHKLRSRFSDWNVCLSIAKMLNDNNKAVVVGCSGMLFRTNEQLNREYLLKNGYIESIITLPKNLLSYTAIETVLIVLSKNNKTVRIVDASNFGTTEKMSTNLSENEILDIVELLKRDAKNSKLLSIEELEKNNFIINNKSIFDDSEDFIQEGVPLKEVIISIKRGISVPSAQLEKMISASETKVKYLPVVAINDGFVDDNLPYIEEDKKLSKSFIKNNSLVITRMANPLKTAVITVNEDENIVPNGNLFAIELDENKIDPYYLKAFLDSKTGKKSLEKLCLGSVIQMLSASSLNDLIIPLPPLEKQKKIAGKFCETILRIKNLKKELNDNVQKLSLIFEIGE